MIKRALLGQTIGSYALTPFDQLMFQLIRLPLWVKQVIYVQLRRELEGTLSKSTLDAFSPEHTLQFWIPELSRHGVAALTSPPGVLRLEVLKLLTLIRSRKSIMNITVLQHWSLAQCATSLMDCLEQDLVLTPQSSAVLGTIEYLAGRIRLGEYLVKINRLTIEQLGQALQTQQAIEEAMGEKTGIANVLINLGYIKKEDSEAILFLKTESEKPFSMVPLN